MEILAMEPIQAVILGVVQGLTEFLPVSSSGHLVLFQKLFGLNEPGLIFEVSVHMGTLMAVVVFFRKEIIGLLAAVGRLAATLARREPAGAILADPEVRLAALIVVGSIPTAAIGLIFNEMADRLYNSTALVGCMLLVTGTLLWGTSRLKTEGRSVGAFKFPAALLIGVAQGMAILPGISRSGATIATGLFLGLDGPTAARYSFLLSIPAILGAQVLSLAALGGYPPHLGIILAGTLTAAMVGYAALAFLVYIVNKNRMPLFAPYCWILGAVTLAISLM
jgi:undecaprenyl-diphosphatase